MQRKEGRKEGRREGGKEGRTEGGSDGGKEGRTEGGKERRREGAEWGHHRTWTPGWSLIRTNEEQLQHRDKTENCWNMIDVKLNHYELWLSTTLTTSTTNYQECILSWFFDCCFFGFWFRCFSAFGCFFASAAFFAFAAFLLLLLTAPNCCDR